MRNDFNRQETLSLSDSDLRQLELRNFSLDALTPCSRQTALQEESRLTLSLSHVSFAYGRRKRRSEAEVALLHDVSFEAYSGEIIGIIGDNGAGKTTLAKLCCGLLKESAGIISIHEKQLPQKKRLGQICFVMQDSDYQLFGDSVLNELRIGAGNKSSNDAENQAILKKLSLWEKRENHPAALSRGQKQRLTIAGALKADSRVLFFDEPTSGLDRGNMLRVAAELKSLARESRVVYRSKKVLIFTYVLGCTLHSAGFTLPMYLSNAQYLIDRQEILHLTDEALAVYLQMFTWPMYFGMVALTVITSFLGAVISTRILKKHFEKAGLL